MDSATSLLRHTALPTALSGGVAVVLGALLGGAEGALGALVGTVLVVVFFSISAYVVDWASRISPQTLLLAGITSYVVKVLGMMVLISAFRDTTWWNTEIFGWTVVGLALIWIMAEVRITFDTRKTYIDEPANSGAPRSPGRRGS